jgi:hypothetical protein
MELVKTNVIIRKGKTQTDGRLNYTMSLEIRCLNQCFS